MKNNDLSNRAAPYIAFDIDSLLHIDVEEKNPFMRMIDSIFLPASKRYIKRTYNYAFTNFVRKLYRDREYNIVFLTRELEEKALEELADRLDKDFIPFSNLSSFETEDSVRVYCSRVFMYLFSADDDLISRLSADNAKHYREAEVILR